MLWIWERENNKRSVNIMTRIYNSLYYGKTCTASDSRTMDGVHNDIGMNNIAIYCVLALLLHMIKLYRICCGVLYIIMGTLIVVKTRRSIIEALNIIHFY